MKSLFLAAALGLLALAPAQANASWLSEALHRSFDPAYNVAPAYDYGYYDAPVYNYSYPSYGYYVAPPTVYYSTPYYSTPGASFYWRSGPRYYGHWHAGYRGWHGGHGGGHGGHGHHHR